MTTDASRAHVDAETLAAWAEHRLSAEAAAAVELHLSNCDRCQEVLAAFVRSEPPAGAAILPFWSRRPVRWSAAGLAAAAAIATMILIGRPPAAPSPTSTVTLNDARADTATPAPAAIDQLKPAASPSAGSAESSTPVEGRQVGKKVAPPTAAQKSARQESSKTSGALVGAGTAAAPPPQAAVQAMPAPPPPPPAPVAQAPPPAQSPQATPSPRAGLSGSISTAAPPMAPPRPSALAESLVAPEVVPVIEIAVPDQETLARRSTTGAGRGTAGGGAAAARDAAANVSQVSWRIVRGTRVERTQDGGANWTAVTIEPELKTVLLAGSATSPTNCWLAGRQGVVLVTTDGRTFKRVSVPESVDLTAITAQDNSRATVTTRDGRKFSTVDGGQTWK